MSDQTPGLEPVAVIDGSRIINVAGATGLTSINGDATPAQTLAAGAGISVTDVGGGSHVIAVIPGPPPVAGLQSINADVTAAQTLAGTAPIHVADGGGGAHTISADDFAGPGTPGVVNAPAGVATDYLARDGTFKTIPAGGAGITSINADVTAAQLVTASLPLHVVDGGGGAHNLTVDSFAGAGTRGVVADPVTSDCYLDSATGWKRYNFVGQNTALVSIPSNSPTVVATITISAGNDGVYLLVGEVFWDAAPNGGRNGAITVNGFFVAAQVARAPENPGVGAVNNCCKVYSLSAGDVVRLVATQYSGGPLNVVSGGFLQVFKLCTIATAT